MLRLLGRYWQRLFRADVAAEPPAFTPRDGETVHARGIARGFDEVREINLGEGTLLVTSLGMVYVADTGKWRFHWQRIAQVKIEDDRSVGLETGSGKRFSFRLRSIEEAEALLRAALTNRNQTGF